MTPPLKTQSQLADVVPMSPANKAVLLDTTPLHVLGQRIPAATLVQRAQNAGVFQDMGHKAWNRGTLGEAGYDMLFQQTIDRLHLSSPQIRTLAREWKAGWERAEAASKAYS